MTTLGKIRFWLGLFVCGLVVSGLTAFPLEWESGLLLHLPMPDFAAVWLSRVHTGLVETNDRYPFLSYGTDWLAFAHLVVPLLLAYRQIQLLCRQKRPMNP